MVASRCGLLPLPRLCLPGLALPALLEQRSKAALCSIYETREGLVDAFSMRDIEKATQRGARWCRHERVT
jgi:hypothetical protein